MTYKQGIRPLLVAMLLLSQDVWASDTVLITKLLYEAPSLAVPMVYYGMDDEKTAHSVNLMGRTLESKNQLKLTKSCSLIGDSSFTWQSTNGVDRLYVQGTWDEKKSWKQNSGFIKVGIAGFSGDLWIQNALLFYRSPVTQAPDEELRNFWRSPFWIYEFFGSYDALHKRNWMKNSGKGFLFQMRYRYGIAVENWQTLESSLSLYKKMQDFSFFSSATFLWGKNLNLVNDFAVGGSFQELTNLALWGSFLSEFHVKKGWVLNASPSYVLNEVWDVGLAGSFLSEPTYTGVGVFTSYRLGGVILRSDVSRGFMSGRVNSWILTASISSVWLNDIFMLANKT